MKTLISLTLMFILLFISCKKDNEKIPDFEKPYRLQADYDGIGKPGLLYVCHITNEFVSVIDPATNELIGKIPCGHGSSGICFSPDKKTGYITNFKSFNLTIFDVKTNKTIETVIAGENPTSLLQIQNGKYLLYSHQSPEGLWVFDAEKKQNIKRLKECTGPLYFIEKENKIYQPQIFIPYLYIIDPDSIEVVKKIETGGRPMEMAFTHIKEFAYMVNFDSNEVAKYDTKTDLVLKKIKNIKNPRGIASTSDNKFIYVTNVIENTVTVINAERDTIETTIPGFKMPTSVVFTPDSKFAYVSNQGQSTVALIDTKEHKIIKTIDVAGNPIWLKIE